MAELAPCVFLKSTQVNRGSQPLLAGPVDLIRNSGLAGRTCIMYVAPGEKFALGWGAEPELRAKRTCDVHDEQSRMLSSWVSRQHEVEVRLSNLGAHSREVRVLERVPVSEVEKVRIEIDHDKTSGSKAPNSDGIIEWTLELEPFGQRRVQLQYTLRKHEDVVGV